MLIQSIRIKGPVSIDSRAAWQRNQKIRDWYQFFDLCLCPFHCLRFFPSMVRFFSNYSWSIGIETTGFSQSRSPFIQWEVSLSLSNFVRLFLQGNHLVLIQKWKLNIARSWSTCQVSFESVRRGTFNQTISLCPPSSLRSSVILLLSRWINPWGKTTGTRRRGNTWVKGFGYYSSSTALHVLYC